MSEPITETRPCACCARDVDASVGWDSLYDTCHDCAFCQSLGHDPCCHSGCREEIGIAGGAEVVAILGAGWEVYRPIEQAASSSVAIRILLASTTTREAAEAAARLLGP